MTLEVANALADAWRAAGVILCLDRHAHRRGMMMKLDNLSAGNLSVASLYTGDGRFDGVKALLRRREGTDCQSIKTKRMGA